MSFWPDLLMRITKAANSSKEEGGTKEEAGTTYIIVRRPYVHLENELRNAFKKQKDVKVIVDRRNGERRKSQKPVKLDRRRADRRRSKEELIEVVIST